jgi:GxxExxY protein
MENQNTNLIARDLSEKIIGIYYEVYNEVGYGFLESVYANCMYLALTDAGLNVQRELAIPVWFRGKDVGSFKADLVVNDCILLELKAVKNLDRAHEAQILNYLRGTSLEVGLLMNFGAPKPEFRRLAFSNDKKKIRVYPRSSAVGGS